MRSGGDWIRVRVERRSSEADGICSFELVSERGDPLPAFEAGAHVDVEVERFVRQYSICSDPADRRRYRIAVLREERGRGGSAAMHERVHEGTLLRISAPRHHFGLSPDASRHLLFAGGIGVTPLLAMAAALHRRGASFELHYCTRSPARTAFAGRLAAARFASCVHVHHDDGPASQRLDIDPILRSASDGTHAYVCGPRGFMEAVAGAARAAGWSGSRIHVESFAPDAPTPARGDRAFDLELARSGRTVHVPADRSAVQALADAGVEVPTSCEQGICGTCRVRVLGGEPEHRDTFLTPAEQAANDVFTPCCSRARTARLVVDL